MGLYMSAKTVELSKDVYQAMRDAIEFSTNNAELSNLASDGAFYKMLDFFKELGYENPSIESMNFMQKRIFELSRQNEEFRKTLEMPAEELNLYKMRANGRNSHKKTLVILRILDNERKEKYLYRVFNTNFDEFKLFDQEFISTAWGDRNANNSILTDLLFYADDIKCLLLKDDDLWVDFWESKIEWLELQECNHIVKIDID